jgi:hypothetical protein
VALNVDTGDPTRKNEENVLHFTDREALQIYTWMGHHCHAPAKPLVNRDGYECEPRPEGPTVSNVRT